VCVIFVAVNQRSSVKLTFGDDDSQQNSPTSKRLRLATDSIDCLADLQHRPTRWSVLPSPKDKTARKFRLLFGGGSSEDLSQPQPLPGRGDHGSNVDSSASDTTSDSEANPSGTGSDTPQSECDGGKDEDAMTQADEEAMKTYVPPRANALTYISDDDEHENVLDFFLKPPSTRVCAANCRTVPSDVDTVKVRHSPSNPTKLNSTADADAAATDDDGNRTVKSASVLSKSSFLLDSHCNDRNKELISSELLIRETNAFLSELVGDCRHLTAVAKASHKSTVRKEDEICIVNERSYLTETAAPSLAPLTDPRTTVGEGSGSTHSVAWLAVCLTESRSQGSDGFRTPACQNSTHNGAVVVLDDDATTRSASSQPTDSDATIDVGCSPIKSRPLATAAASPTRCASDATTTDGCCTPCKSSITSVVGLQSPRSQFTDCARQLRTSDVVGPRSPRSNFDNLSSSVVQKFVHDVPPKTSLSSAVCPGSCSRFTELRSSTGLHQTSSSSEYVQLLALCREESSSALNDISPADCYDGDVDSDSDDVIGDVTRRRAVAARRRRPSDPVLVISSSSSDSDQSQPLLRARDRGKDGGVATTTLSSGSESDYSALAGRSEADCQRASAADDAAREPSPVLFSESST